MKFVILVGVLSLAACGTSIAARLADEHGRPLPFRQLPENSFDSAGNRCAIVDTPYNSWLPALTPGNYCLDKDLSQKDFLRPLSLATGLGKWPSSPLISIGESDTSIDLMGHRLVSDVDFLSGIELDSFGKIPKRHIRIKNGKLSKTGGAMIVMGTLNDYSDHRFHTKGGIKNFDGDSEAYPETDFILENLTLEGDNEIIVMQGKRNIIRNCKIIGGNSTVNLMGPNLIFENNEIIFNARPHGSKGDGPPVALYLEDAKDSIVRNNRIIVLSHDVPDAASIVLRNSPNVKLESNTVSGVASLFTMTDTKSSVVERDNHLTPSVGMVDRLRYSVFHH